jgi:hypothetical protein
MTLSGRDDSRLQPLREVNAMQWILGGSRRASASRRRKVQPEPAEMLESRQLLTSTSSYTFAAPDLSPLLHRPNSTAAMFNLLTGSLQAQLVAQPSFTTPLRAPIPDLKVIGGVTPPAGLLSPAQFVAAVENMVQGYEQAAAQQAPGDRKLNQLVQLQGTALDAQMEALLAQNNAGLLSNTPRPGITSPYYNANLVAVEHLTLSRPLWPYGTPMLPYINRTEIFQTDLNNAAGTISTLGIAAAADLAHVAAASYVADINLSTLQRPGPDRYLTQQVTTLLSSVDAAAQMGPSGAAAFKAAVATFTSATYDPATGAGYLGPRGAFGKNFIQPTTYNQVPAGAPTIDYSTGNTFQYGKYHVIRLKQARVYHRNYGNLSSGYGDPSNLYGRFVTTTLYPTPAAAVRGSALDQTFLPPTNTAFYVEDVRVGTGHYLYVGKTAPIYQGILTPRNTLYPGLGPQIVIDNTRAPDVIFYNQRTTGT